jgi:hypothetical protein
MKRKKNRISSSTSRKLNDEIETLFRFTPPKQMKKSLHEVYAVYLQNLEDVNFKEIAADMYLLHKFFDKAAELWNMEDPES